MGIVDPDGTITFDFHEIGRSAIPADIVARYGADGVDWCFNENKDTTSHLSSVCAAADAPAGPAARP
ncbi:MAG: hypothetical protein DMF58_12600 [Acidobacteria bacterium]|nr:MAG: hypothetical protein DMF58_12600 [Acidobacteriota bacterium]